MSPRPKNPPPDRRKEILDAALGVFSSKGFTAATNADIARAAGVTPAALYYYFPSKGELFKAAISERRGAIMPILEGLDGALLDLPPREVLPALARNMVQFMSEERTRAVLRIVFSEGPHDPEVARIYREQVVDTIIRFIMTYVARQMERGTLRRMPPPLFMMLMAGPLIATLFTRDFLHIPLMAEVTDEELLRQMTEVLIPALTQEPGPTNPEHSGNDVGEE